MNSKVICPNCNDNVACNTPSLTEPVYMQCATCGAYLRVDIVNGNLFAATVPDNPIPQPAADAEVVDSLDTDAQAAYKRELVNTMLAVRRELADVRDHNRTELITHIREMTASLTKLLEIYDRDVSNDFEASNVAAHALIVFTKETVAEFSKKKATFDAICEIGGNYKARTYAHVYGASDE